jgi:glycosyltransferase involved in cell wall biosynthesis
VWFLAAAGGAPDPGWHPLPVAGDGSVGVYVPVNPMAERHRHHGFGFTGYLLVLSGRAAAEDEPPPEVAWLSAAFTDEHVVLVEQAAASAWRARALRGRVSVDTRMDLWRLLAHAAVCVDLGPGGLVARECIEALRLGTPVVAPAGGAPVAALAAAGAAVTYGDAGELVDAVGALRDAPTRQAASERGRRHADAQHGDPARSVERLGQLLGGA